MCPPTRVALLTGVVGLVTLEGANGATTFDFTFYFLAVLSLVTFFQSYAAKSGFSDSKDWLTISARTA